MAQFSELYGNALDVQLNSADRSQLFTTARRQHEINEGEREFVKQTECLTKQSTLALSTAVVSNSSGATELDLSSQITDLLWLAPHPVEVRYSDSNGSITYYSRDELPRRDVPYLDRYTPGWRTASASTPQSYYLREDGPSLLLGLTPPPSFSTATSSETWSAVVNYVAWPSSMTSDSHVPLSSQAHLRPWHQALVHFAASRLELLRGDVEASERQAGMFAGYVADYLRRQRPKGGSQVTYDRSYRRERYGTPFRDPKVDW